MKQAEAEFDAVYGACTGDSGTQPTSSSSEPIPEATVTSSHLVETVSDPVEPASPPTEPESVSDSVEPQTSEVIGTIFRGPGRPRMFNLSMDSKQGLVQLILNRDSTLTGTMSYDVGTNRAVHQVKGRCNANGTVSLDEYTDGEADKQLVCTLSQKGACLEGSGKTLAGESIPISICLE